MIELKSFSPPAEKIALQADFLLYKEGIQLDFQLSDPGAVVQNSLRPASWAGADLQRSDGLWKDTCFEAFWSQPGEKSYWELNLSPAGKWNLYFFEDYRKPQPPSISMDFSIQKMVTTKNSLSCKISTKKDFAALELSICAVIKTANTTYFYSSAHCGSKPDFHLRESFTLRVLRSEK